MLRFSVYDEHGLAEDWPLHHAHLVGPDDMPARGTIRFTGGHLECDKSVSTAVGLAILWDAGPMGRLVLPTCLLPDREEPYLLTLELARHRIKTFIAKSEEWQMFDLSADHPAMQLWEEARRLFTRAWTSVDPLKADRWAQQSLIHAIDATERLAMAHAEILLHRRYAAKAASSSTLGIRIWPGRDAQPLRNIIEAEFDVLSIPLCWRHLEVEEGKYNWEPVDRWMQWAQSTGKPIMAGPLIDFSRRAVPEWMYVWQHDYDTTRDLMYDHIERVVRRYAPMVGMWNLVSGINTNENFTFTADQMLDLTRMASLLVRQHRRGARTMVDIAQPFGEHCGGERKSTIYPFTYLDRVIQAGIHIDAIGVRLLFGTNLPGLACRDLMQISSQLDKFFLYEKPILVSALGAPSSGEGETAGTWHEDWSNERQARWITRLFAICLSKPFIDSLFWCDLFDHDGAELPGGGLIDDAGRAKPAMQQLIKLRRRFRRPLGELKLPART